MPLSVKRAPRVTSPETNRVVQDVYGILNEIINAVNQSGTSEVKSSSKGKSGDIKVVKDASGQYFLEAKADEGWIQSDGGSPSSFRFRDNVPLSASGNLGPIVDLTASVTMQTDEYPSGSILRFTPPAGAGNLNITLPTHETGLVYYIYQMADYTTAPCNVLSEEGNDWEGFIDAAAGVGDTATATDDKVIFGSATLAGDRIAIFSNLSKWFVFQSYSKNTSNGVLFG